MGLFPAPPYFDDVSTFLIEDILEVNKGTIENSKPIKSGAVITRMRTTYNIVDEFVDIFACSYFDMHGLDISFAMYILVVNEYAKPI